jgi:hypothetical protein
MWNESQFYVLKQSKSNNPYQRIGITTKNTVGAVVTVWEMLTRLISVAFPLSFYTTFSHPFSSLAEILPT